MRFDLKKSLTGLIAATFTPMNPDGSLNLDMVPQIVDHLVENNIKGLYVCGSTGEGPSLSGAERKLVAEAYVKAAAGRIPVIVQIGHNSIFEARELAEHAASIGADAISAVPPSYYKISSLDNLIACLKEIADAAARIPFFYYHITALTGLACDAVELLEKAGNVIPNFAGIKYSNCTVHEYQACLNYQPDKYVVLFGCDEMLSSSLSVGAPGAVGSTYNFAPKLYNDIIAAYKNKDLDEVARLQALSVEMVRVLCRFRGQPGIKSSMKLIGLDCGPNRLPLEALSDEEIEQMRQELTKIGFFDWAV